MKHFNINTSKHVIIQAIVGLVSLFAAVIIVFFVPPFHFLLVTLFLFLVAVGLWGLLGPILNHKQRIITVISIIILLTIQSFIGFDPVNAGIFLLLLLSVNYLVK